MVVIYILPHAESGRNDHREDAPNFSLMIRPLYKILFPDFYKNEQPANRSHDIISSSILLSNIFLF